MAIKKSPKRNGFIKIISRESKDGMPMATTIKDKIYVLITKYLKIEIVNSYSKDGINWSNPVGIYVSQNNGTKYSPPVVFYDDNNNQNWWKFL